MGKIVVIGSINMDLLFITEKRPQLGETVKGLSFAEFPGGKGANQAVAAAKLGANVHMVGSVGKDRYGQYLSSHLKSEGVVTEKIKSVDNSTGLANIILDKSGENTIIIIEGANGEVKPENIDPNLFEEGDYVLFQLEIPMETVVFGAKLAKEKKAMVILDPAPVKKLPEELYNYIDIIKPNELEALELTEESSVENAAQWLLNKGVKTVVITLGDKGALLYTEQGSKKYPAKKVEVVDTTAAGDSFSGALATALVQGEDIDKAIEFAIRVSAITVTRIGAQSSLPTLEQLGGKI